VLAVKDSRDSEQSRVSRRIFNDWPLASERLHASQGAISPPAFIFTVVIFNVEIKQEAKL